MAAALPLAVRAALQLAAAPTGDTQVVHGLSRLSGAVARGVSTQCCPEVVLSATGIAAVRSVADGLDWADVPA